MNNNENLTATRVTTISKRGKVTQTIECRVGDTVVFTLKGKAEVRKGFVWAALTTNWWNAETRSMDTTPKWFVGASARQDLAEQPYGGQHTQHLTARVTGAEVI